MIITHLRPLIIGATRLTLLLAILTLALSIQYLHAWTGPPSSAPTCAPGQTGCDAPLNVGTTNQTKSGGLTVGGGAGGFAVLASQYIQGKLGIGSGKASPAYLIDLGGVAGTDGIRFPDGTVQVSAGAIPSGMYAPFKGPTCPSGWLVADGTNGTADLRGQFVRGWSNGSTTDSGRTVGSAQGDAMRNITGTIGPIDGVYTGVFAPGSQVGYGGTLNSQGPRYWAKFDASTVVPTASENRPTNIALLYCYKTQSSFSIA